MGCYFSGIEIEPGDIFTRPSAGGGGYRDPLEREPEKVLEDVIDGYVSIERAKKDYGVVIRVMDEELGLYEIDYEETRKLREFIRSNRIGWLDEDPEKVKEMLLRGELDYLDVIRRYGVIIDKRTGKVLYNTTKVYRELLKIRAAEYWK